jgi:hypothetical protein
MELKLKELEQRIDELSGKIDILQNEINKYWREKNTIKRNNKPTIEQVVKEFNSRKPNESQECALSFATKFFNHYEEINWKVNGKNINWKLRMTNNWNLDKFVREYKQQNTLSNGTEQRIGRVSQSALEDFLNKG